LFEKNFNSVILKKISTMADTNDDEWLYGDSGEEKEAVQHETQQDEPMDDGSSAIINEKAPFDSFVDEHEHNFEVNNRQT
jgi:hypothetical protein